VHNTPCVNKRRGRIGSDRRWTTPEREADADVDVDREFASSHRPILCAVERGVCDEEVTGRRKDHADGTLGGSSGGGEVCVDGGGVLRGAPAANDVRVLVGHHRRQLVVQSVGAAIAAHVHARCGPGLGFGLSSFRPALKVQRCG
jgi:hypothetical protein